jgi:hypothetical protein
MSYILRVIVLLFVVPATYFFIYWVPFSLVLFIQQRWIPSIVSMVCAAGVGWYVWRKLGSMPSDLISSISLGGVVLGGIGFCVGFFGPLVFAPEANQGPLLGIFITGPLGLLFGAVGGFIYWWVKRKKAEVTNKMKDRV